MWGMGAKREDGRRLVLILNGDPNAAQWMVVALEGLDTEDEGLGALLANHAHAEVEGSPFHSFDHAQAAAENFAHRWLEGGSLEQCTCGEITVKGPGHDVWCAEKR